MASTSNTDEHLLLARVEDTVQSCDKYYAPIFFGFLDLREQAFAKNYLSRMSCNYAFFGGYNGAERCLLGVYPDYLDTDDVQPPITAVAFRYRPVAQISHRDVLGALLSSGIRRDKIGDILCGDGLSVVFLQDDIVTYVCEQVDQIGGEGVACIRNYDGALPLNRVYKDIQDTIASPRLDAVVKALTRFSREKAADTIHLGLVSVDHLVVLSTSANVVAPCTISVRGVGRFLIDVIGPPTKKGRLILTARKCI